MIYKHSKNNNGIQKAVYTEYRAHTKKEMEYKQHTSHRHHGAFTTSQCPLRQTRSPTVQSASSAHGFRHWLSTHSFEASQCASVPHSTDIAQTRPSQYSYSKQSVASAQSVCTEHSASFQQRIDGKTHSLVVVAGQISSTYARIR